jgi:hypothetical protein
MENYERYRTTTAESFDKKCITDMLKEAGFAEIKIVNISS